MFDKMRRIYLAKSTRKLFKYKGFVIIVATEAPTYLGFVEFQGAVFLK